MYSYKPSGYSSGVCVELKENKFYIYSHRDVVTATPPLPHAFLLSDCYLFI